MGIIIDVACGSGGMADAHGSGPCVGNNMRVQVPSSAFEMKKSSRLQSLELFFISKGESPLPLQLRCKGSGILTRLAVGGSALAVLTRTRDY